MAKQKARKITDAPIGCTHPAFLVEDGKCKGCGKPLEQQVQAEGPPTACEKADECIHAGDDCTQKGAEERTFGCFEVEPMTMEGTPTLDVGEAGEEIELPVTPNEVAKPEESAPESSTFSSSDTSAPFDRELPVQIPDDELAERGAEMARLIEVWTKAKLDKKAQDQAFKRLIDETEEKYVALAEEVRAGTEVRPVACYWQFDPAHMCKRLIRCDTGALVEERAMELLDLEQCPNHQAQNSVENAEDLRQKQATDESPASETGELTDVQGEVSPGEETPATGQFQEEMDPQEHIGEEGWPDPGPNGPTEKSIFE